MQILFTFILLRFLMQDLQDIFACSIATKDLSTSITARQFQSHMI